ncbi:MAG: hypothetical protein HY301_03965 [Verrucomicrobia bacterium]|nr:hypothetical protein [Verrucomicrobiota bacterium]
MIPTSATRVIRVTDLTNAEFLARHARAGRVGLSGGHALIDHAIARAQRHVDEGHEWSRWSHAFFFQGTRADGHHWVIESDLQFHRKHIALGVQENRATKYHDEKHYARLAVLEFDLSPEHEAALVREGLELVATRTRYSIRELFGTLLAMRQAKFRNRPNLLARDQSLFCSAMVRHIFHQAGVDLTPGLDVKNTVPEHLARSPLVKTMWALERAEPPTRLQRVEKRLRAVKAKLKRKRE